MPAVQWDETLSVGVARFDEEHQQLIALINELDDAVQGGRGAEVLGRILDGLADYTDRHFAHEERLMEQTGCPGLEEHRRQHRELARQVVELQERYRAGTSRSLSLELVNFLMTWLVQHIKGTDKAYMPFLAGRTPP